MMRIAVLGANGQVGSEVSLALSLMPGVDVVPVVRSALAGAFLERCGLSVRVAAAPDYAAALSDADVVIDFTLPGGLPSQIEGGAAANTDAVVSAIREDATYIYCSSTIAAGVSPSDGRYGPQPVARSQYAATKRSSERHVIAAGRARGRRTFVFRLGEVHGELQGVSRLWSRRFQDARGPLVVGSHLTDVVFTPTIALATTRLVGGVDSTGIYALLDSPEWRLDELVRHYLHCFGVRREVVVSEAAQEGSFVHRATGAVKKLIAGQRELLTAHVLPRELTFEWRIKARWLRARVRSELASPLGERFDSRIGPVPGRRLECLVDSRSAAIELQARVRNLLQERLGPGSHAFPSAS